MNTHKLAENVAVITVSYNSSAQLESFLSSAIQSVSDSSQIFVADNASSDKASTRKLCKLFQVNLVELPRNIGYGAAINEVVSGLEPRFDTLLISNPDCILNSQAISELTTISNQSHIGVVGPKIVNSDGSIYASAREIPSLSNGIGHALFANLWPANPWTKSYHTATHEEKSITKTGWVSGACLAINRETFESFSGFDAGYFMYFEDVDLGYRLGNAGYTNLFVPDVSVTHIGGESTKATKKYMLRIHHQSAKKFLKAKYPGILWSPVRLVVSMGLQIRLWVQLMKTPKG